MGMMYVDKPCERCGIALTKVHFSTKFCPACKAIRQRETNRQALARRAADPERHARVNAMKRERYMRKRDEILAKAKEHRQEHPEVIRECKRRYAAKRKAQSLKAAAPVKDKRPAKRDRDAAGTSAMAMLKAAVAEHKAARDRSAYRTVSAVLPMRECARLHLRSTTLPCGADMDVCRGCPCLPA